MIKNYDFESNFGHCTYEFKDNSYYFSATCYNGTKLRIAIPANSLSFMFFSTEGDIVDTCRGLVDMLTAGAMDSSILQVARDFKDCDVFVPNFIGNYHTCLLEQTPYNREMLRSVLGPEAFNIYMRVTDMFVDCGNQIITIPANAVKKVA